MNNATKAQRKYDESNARRYQLKMNIKTDADIIDRLERAESMQGYIKELIRQDIDRDNGITTMYSIINMSVEEVNKALDDGDLEYETLYTTNSIGAILREISGKDDSVSISIYRINDDGDFLEGTDFDRPSNFIKHNRIHA